MKSTDVIISGGGIPGLTLGILLAEAGLDVVLCDPSPLIAPEEIPLSGRTSALMEGSLAVLAQAGILESVESSSEDLKILSIIDRDFRADFECNEIRLSRFGQNIQNTLLQAYAAEKFRSLKNALFIQDELKDFYISANKVQAEFSNGEIFTAKLLIGADGRNSFVRNRSGIEIWRHDYDQMALTGIVSHTKSHRHNSIEFHFSGGPFTFVPLKDDGRNMISSFVWMEKSKDAKKILKISTSEIEAIMQERSQNIFGKVSLMTPVEAFPIRVQKSKSITGERLALIAEAAHVLSPIGAQGMNLSLRDVKSLADKIINAARYGLDFGSKQILKAYETDRALDIGLRIAGTDALNRSVATENDFMTVVRRLGFRAAANLPMLRTLLIREGLAPAHSLTQDMLSGLETRATVRTSTRAAPAA